VAERFRRRKSVFLDKYRLNDAYLRPPDRVTGRVGLTEGVGPDGEAIIIKKWPRSARQNDADLEAIWRNEIRQLHRMAGHPVAHDVIAKLVDAGVDTEGFYLVIEPGSRRPIATSLDRPRGGEWLTAPRQAVNRLRIWRNLRRIIVALEALHGEGMLHRDLDAWSVLSGGGEEPDFQLTGFEWSMRLVASGSKGKGNPRKAAEASVSFRADWAAFSKLASRLVDADWARVNNPSIPAFGVADHLFAAEVRLLRNLAGIEPLDRLDGDVVLKQVDQIIASVAADAAGKDMKLQLVFDLRADSPIGRLIATHRGIDTMSIVAELPAIIEADLSNRPMLVGVLEDGDDTLKLLLRGHDYWYRLRAYRASNQATPSWEYAECGTMAKQGPAPINVVGTIQLASDELELMTLAEARQRFPRSRGRLRSWDTLRTRLTAPERKDDAALEFHHALTLTLIIELLFAVAESFPVRLLPATTDATGSDDTIINLVPRADVGRDRLAQALGLQSPGDRLRGALTGDGLRREGWILTTEGSLGHRSVQDGEWKFESEVKRRGKETAYQFCGAERPSETDPLFLVPEDSVGRDTQLRRRLKALGALREHLELQRALTTPISELIESHDPEPAFADLGDLDASKREAMRQIIGTLPLYLVQGPPGVGKTRLVRELVKRRLHDEPTLRLLLSAQSNAAVDHLLSEVVPATENGPSGLLIIRCGSGREGEDRSEYRLAKVARETLTQIGASNLVASSRPALRDRFRKLERGAQVSTSSVAVGETARYPADLRTFESVVMRAANLVFATTNSADLERLIEEHSQFDWTIIEEAGKATGSELIAPQLLSHRRLMIGDHKQLPPFNADMMIALLKQPEKVADALSIGAEFIGRSLRDEATEAIIDDVADNPAAAAPICAQAIGALTLFETLIEEEFMRPKGRSGRTFAMRLNEQHRMHPAIARLIGSTFYPAKAGTALSTHADSAMRFATAPCPVHSLDSALLPEVPILFVEMETRQAGGGRIRGEEAPRWHNGEEREAVRLILRQLRPTYNAKPPTLAILSPYAQQVVRISDMIAKESAIDPAAIGFVSPTGDSCFCFTVDSFQGSEADVAIVSLVRNNSYTGIRNALGFLSDFRRMNVLLSRAKWRLVVIGAFGFLEEILESARIEGKSAEIEFLGTLFKELGAASPKEFQRIGIERLKGGEK
jgi:AAA domain